MAAPSTLFTDNNTGTISATGESNGLLLRVGKGMNRATFGTRGTFTGATLAVRGHLTGLSASSYYPVPGVTKGSQVPVQDPTSISLTNSTNAAFTFDSTGCDFLEVWCPAGTLTDFNVDAEQSFADANTPPILQQVQTSATTVSANETFTDNTLLYFGTGNDIGLTWNGTNLVASQAAADSAFLWGASGAGINHTFYGDTAGRNLDWDQSNDQLLFADSTLLSIGSGAGAAGDISLSWDGTRLNVTQLTANSEIRYGVDGAGIDQRWYGDTASAFALWDQSADALVFGGVAGITNLKVKQSTAVAITGATSVALADSGGIFTVSQAAAYDIDLPSPTTGAGATYFFSLTAPGANAVTLTVAGSAATFVGSIQIDGTTVVATGSTLTFASGAASLGDSISVRSIATNLYHVVCMGAAAGAITIS